MSSLAAPLLHQRVIRAGIFALKVHKVPVLPIPFPVGLVQGFPPRQVVTNADYLGNQKYTAKFHK